MLLYVLSHTWEEGGGRWVVYILSRGMEEVATCKIDGAVINRYYAMCFFNINWSALMMLWKRAIVRSACIFHAPATDLPETSGLERLRRRRQFSNEHCVPQNSWKTRLVRADGEISPSIECTMQSHNFSCAFVKWENCKRFYMDLFVALVGNERALVL